MKVTIIKLLTLICHSNRVQLQTTTHLDPSIHRNGYLHYSRFHRNLLGSLLTFDLLTSKEGQVNFCQCSLPWGPSYLGQGLLCGDKSVLIHGSLLEKISSVDVSVCFLDVIPYVELLSVMLVRLIDCQWIWHFLTIVWQSVKKAQCLCFLQMQLIWLKFKMYLSWPDLQYRL